MRNVGAKTGAACQDARIARTSTVSDKVLRAKALKIFSHLVLCIQVIDYK
jgi:hypothetical protein